MALKPKKKQQTTASFVSHVRLANGVQRELQCLPGETLISECQNVVRYKPFFDKTELVFGTLYVTNFKICFIETDEHKSPDSTKQRNKLMREDDIVLNCVDTIYQVSKGKRKKILLSSGSNFPFVKNLEIHTKNFRVHFFSFKFVEKEKKSVAKQTINAIIHHSFPTRYSLLFAYDCKLNTNSNGCQSGTLVKRFNEARDWQGELDRLNVRGVHVLPCNSGFLTCSSLPEAFAVPDCLHMSDVKELAAHFEDNRIPVWSYTVPAGASLIRTAYEKANNNGTHGVKLMEKLSQCCPNGDSPEIADLHESYCNVKLPSAKELQVSHEKLKELIRPATFKDATAKDDSWLSHLESTNWLQIVIKCLSFSLAVLKKLVDENRTVVLKESNGRELSPMVSCLVQIMADKTFRTMRGFQELIEREWVALGYDFTNKLGLLINSKPIPAFLLFIDCVWQLQQQFPSAFEFSEIYLTSLWDTLCLGLFDNFIFDSVRQRHSALGVEKFNPQLSLMSAWDWSLQYDDEDCSLFNNPLYTARTELNLQIPQSHQTDKRLSGSVKRAYSIKLANMHESIPQQTVEVLRPVVKAPVIKLWLHCYLRWITPLQIQNGGSPAEYLQQCLLVEEIRCLQHKLNSLKRRRTAVASSRPLSNLLFSSFSAATGAPPSNGHTTLTSDLALTSSFPYNPDGKKQHGSKVSTFVSSFLENSFIQEAPDNCDDE